MECKDGRLQINYSDGTGINRNIVECKEPCAFDIRNQVVCINRNIVECKDHQRYGVNGTADVLIETLWNVKSGIRAVITSSAVSINRNIVECKENFPLQYLLQIPWY